MAAAPCDATAANTILVFGDSLSAGYGLPREQTWPALLARRLKQEAPDYTVANASISGETASGGARRIASTLTRYKPAIVIVALGGNDGLRGHNIDDMRANLETIISVCQKANARVLLAGMRIPPNYGSDYTSKFRATFSNLAQKHNLAHAPFLLEGFANKPEWFQADGIHPTAKAQSAMLETVWKALGPVLAEGVKKLKRIQN